MAFVSDLAVCLSLIQSIVEIASEIEENWKTIGRLAKRAQIFEECLTTLEKNVQSGIKELPEATRKGVAMLKDCLERVMEFINSYHGKSMKPGWIKLSITAFTKVAFRKEHAAEIAALNTELNECCATLQITALFSDKEAERRADLEV